MNKRDLVKHVAKEVGVTQPIAKKVIDEFLEKIRKSLLFGMNVNITDFASFNIIIHKEKKVVIPSTGEEKLIPKHYRIKTKFSNAIIKAMKDKPVY